MPQHGPSVYFYPETGWEITPYTQTRPAVCTASTRFNNGFAFAVTGTSAGVNNISFDFSQPIFEPGTAFPVTLAIPGHMRETLTARAYTPEAFAIALEGRASFYDTLTRASIVDLYVGDGNAFRFYLTGFAGQNKAFKSCLHRNTQGGRIAALTSEPGGESSAVPNAAGLSYVPAGPDTPPGSSSATGDQAIDNIVKNVNITPEKGRAPPPPLRPLRTTEPEIKMPNPDVLQRSLKAYEEYSRELARILPPREEPPTVPIREVIPGEPNNNAQAGTPPPAAGYGEQRSVSMPDPYTHQSRKRKRLTQMLDEEMKRQNVIQGGREVYVERYDEGPEMTSTLSAPLMQRGSAEERALADILLGGDDDEEGDDGTNVTITPKKKIPEDIDTRFKPIINKQSKTLSVDLTDDGSGGVEAARELPVSDRSWLEILEEEDQPPFEEIHFESEPDTPAISQDIAPEMTARPVRKPGRVVRTGEQQENETPSLETVAIPQTGRPVAVEKPKAIAPIEPDPVFTAAPPAPQAQPPAPDPALQNELRQARAAIRALREQNTAIQRELDYALEQAKQEKTSIASQNWNLEHATSLYNEAKNQIDRLGAQLRKERAQCAAEKKELERMLFDPELTSNEQLAKLAQLEDRLNEARQKLEEQRQIYEGRIRLLEAEIGKSEGL